MSINRRTFLKGSFATGALGVAAGLGLLKPTQVLAAWPDNAFQAKTVEDALRALTGTTNTEPGAIKIKAPDIAENGAVVPITVSAKLDNVDSISILVAKNPQPLAASFDMKGDLETFVSTRIKMGETSDVIAVIKSGDTLYSSKKTVKVTIGGCGG